MKGYLPVYIYGSRLPCFIPARGSIAGDADPERLRQLDLAVLT